MMNRLSLLLIVALGACATGNVAQRRAAVRTSASGPSAAQLVAARQAGMHMAATLLYRGIKAGVKNGTPVKELIHEPEGIALWAAAIPGLFPPGSAHKESRALPAIWANKTDFDRKAADLAAAADRLAALAKAEDSAAFAAQAPAVEAACAACHKLYRSG
jgi:cytochrome c556